MPAVKTMAIAASRPDGSVVIHHMVVQGDEQPTAEDIARSINRAGLSDCVEFARVDELPSREHRDAWVLRGGRIEVDPSRIVSRAQPDSPAAVADDRDARIRALEEQVSYIANNVISGVEVIKS